MLSHVICYSHCIPIYWWLKTPNFDPHRISNAAPQPVALLPERRATVVEHLGVSLLNSTKKLSVELQWQCQNIYITRIYPWFFCKCTGLKYIIWLITYYIIQVYCIQNMKKMFTIYNLRMKISGKAWIFGMDCRCFNTGNAWCPFTSYHPYTNGLICMGGS